MNSTIHAWSHLPYANLIDDLMASAIEHPKEWEHIEDELHTIEIIDAYNDYDSIKNCEILSKWEVHWEEICNLHEIGNYNSDHAARDAIVALFAFDNCEQYLDSTPDEVELLAKLGLPAARLMKLAVISLNKIRERKL